MSERFDLKQLEAIIAERIKASDAASSYTKKLFDSGTKQCCKKLGEEAFETVIAALGEDKDAFVRESADLMYHFMVLLAVRGVPLDAVLSELENRTLQSGLTEKASRTTD